MPCALEALTVIKTSVVCQLFSSCKRTGENAKDWMSSTMKTNQTNPQTKQTTKTHRSEKKKASSELSETINYAFRTNRTLRALSSSSRRHGKIPQVDRCPTLPIVMKDFPAYIPAVEKMRYIHVLVDAAAQDRSSSHKSGQNCHSVWSHLYNSVIV